MGKPRKRVSPQIANHVNRDLDSLMVRCIVSAVYAVKSPWEPNRVGSPCWNPRIVAIGCFIKIFFCRTYDGVESYLKSSDIVHRLLGTNELPGHSVIARGMAQMPTSYIRLVSRHITFQLRHRGMNVAVDSTGFSLKTSSKWFDIRIQRVSKKRDYIKLHIVIDVDTGIILQFTITNWRGSDSKEFKRLIKDLPRLGKVAGDKAYSSRKNCQAVADKKGTPYLHFKENAKGRAKGYPEWRISFRAYCNNREEWLAEYHIRSVIEGVFSSLKRCWGSEIKSKKGWLKRKELSIKVLAYNIKRVLYVERAGVLGVPLWVIY